MVNVSKKKLKGKEIALKEGDVVVYSEKRKNYQDRNKFAIVKQNKKAERKAIYNV